MRHGSRNLFAALLLATAAPAAAQPPNWSPELASCLLSASWESTARACDAVIAAGRDTPANLARAYVGRAGRMVAVGADGRTRVSTDLDRAIADFTEAIRLDPTLAAAYDARALAWREKGDFERALADFADAIRLAQADNDRHAVPRLHHLYMDRGRTWRDKGDFARAIDDFNAALASKPADYNRAVAIHQRGVTFRMMREFDRALADFDALLEDNYWSRALAFADRGWLHLLKGDMRAVGSDFSAAFGRMEHRGALALALYGRGLARQQTGDQAGGRADHAAAAAVDRHLFQQLERIGEGLLTGGAERARIAFDNAFTVIPDRTAAAWVLYGRGIVRSHFGDSTGGKADQAAARIIAPAAVEDIIRQRLN